MPRPLADWPPFESDDLIASPRSPINDLISGSTPSFSDYAKAVLASGFPESAGISNRSRALTRAQARLDVFNARSTQEIAQLNNDEHQKLIADFHKIRDERIAAKSRLQSALDDANAFIPPSADHQKFVDFLILQLQDAIAAIELSGPDPPKPTNNAFRVREVARLQFAIDRTVDLVERESAADIQWVKDLKDSLP